MLGRTANDRLQWWSRNISKIWFLCPTCFSQLLSNGLKMAIGGRGLTDLAGVGIIQKGDFKRKMRKSQNLELHFFSHDQRGKLLGKPHRVSKCPGQALWATCIRVSALGTILVGTEWLRTCTKMAFKWYPSVSNDWHWKTENSFEVEGHYCQLFKLGHICGVHWLYLSITSPGNQLKTSPTELAPKNPIQIPLLTVSRTWLIFYFLVSTHLPLELSHTGFLSAAKRPPFLGSSALARLLYGRLSSHLSGVRSNVTSTVCGYLNDLPPPNLIIPCLSFMSCWEPRALY